MRLREKSGIITGASSGIGEAAARLFVQEGGRVVISARRGDRLEALAEDLGRDRVCCVVGDVADEAVHKRLVDVCLAEFGALDFAFNNAGMVGPGVPLVETTVTDWQTVMSTNLTSCYFAAKYQLPAMTEASKGSIVFTSSFVGHTVGLPGMAAYAASKAGINGLVQVLAAEVGANGVRVNALLPGGTLTEMAGDDEGFHEFVRGLHALKRIADPEEIARAALFLCSDEASFVTGSAMLADGGNSICKT
ncbi:MAG: short-chain dehydrogenase [Ponticaulis sp.]|mgnify:CR=1 FL=1|nr:short-chain dehydrogenase [Ponticaulis sp.]